MANWDFADMSHEAKLFGGPELYREALRNEGIAEGRIQGGMVTMMVMGALGALGAWCYAKKQKETRAIEANMTIAETKEDPIEISAEEPEQE